jgi:hypothetical protein
VRSPTDATLVIIVFVLAAILAAPLALLAAWNTTAGIAAIALVITAAVFIDPRMP